MIHTIQRPGGECVFDEESTGEAVAEYQDDINLGNQGGFVRRFGFAVDVSGDHKGPPIRVIVVNPRMEYDESWSADYDKITYEDGEKIDDIVDDTYHDAITAEVESVLKNT